MTAMTRRSAVTASSGSVFADLGLPNAAEEDTKMDLAVAINDAISERAGSPQSEIAKLIGATQPQVSALAHYKITGFSIGRLIDFLAALDRDVEIRYRRSEHGHGHIRVRELAD
jgi:predicted XRE-type DNA-binding protein